MIDWIIPSVWKDNKSNATPASRTSVRLRPGSRATVEVIDDEREARIAGSETFEDLSYVRTSNED
jgi:hypothetical protein